MVGVYWCSNLFIEGLFKIMGFGKWILDSLRQADEMQLKKYEIDKKYPQPPSITNNYFITINNRVIRVNESEFREWVKKNQLTYGRKMLE